MVQEYRELGERGGSIREDTQREADRIKAEAKQLARRTRLGTVSIERDDAICAR